MQSWAGVAKDAKTQAGHAQKKINGNAPSIEVVKTHKENTHI